MSILTLQEFVSVFKYEADSIDSWRIIKDSPYSGDCEDFSITVAYLEYGSLIRLWLNILTFRYRFYWCKSPSGESHIILKTPKGWIDNIFPSWRDKPTGHTKVIQFFWPLVVLKMLLGKIT